MDLRIVALALLVISFSCGDDKVISEDDYDRSCNMDEDCTCILVGDICDCVCEWGSINKAERGRYTEDRYSIECNSDCSPCESTFVSKCIEGICNAVPGD